MAAYKDVFLSESAEYLQAMTEGLIELESSPESVEPVETVFRGAHSLKGMAAAMGYSATAELTHKMETAMDAVRRKVRAADAELVDLMLRALDAVRALIDEESEGRPAPDSSTIVGELLAAAEGGEAPASPASAPGGRRVRVVVTLDEATALKSVRAYMVIKRLGHLGTVVDTVPSAREIEDERFERAFEVVVESGVPLEEMIAAAAHVTDVESVDAREEEPPARQPVEATEPEQHEGRARRPVTKLAETQTVRVSIGHLDHLVDLVGELVILRARLDRLAAAFEDRGLTETVEELHRVTAELQHEVMQTRMVPVGNIFNRFPRMVRDLARDLGKEVSFEMDGLDIELDRTVLDEIGDPIVHLLRNSIDHGVEPPADRGAAGKASRATVRLQALRERDQVSIIVADDGRGMDLDRIWRRAVEAGLVREAERESYTDRDVAMLTCTPGFSTVDEATRVSGRGVGMDVVKGKIEYLGGSLEISTGRGTGTAFELSLPLTLAIVQVLLMSCGEQVYAVALSAVAEVLSPEEVRIETVDGTPVVVLRTEEVVPLFPLWGLLNDEVAWDRSPGSDEQIVLVSHGAKRNAVLVDGIVGRQEVVIKPLSRLFKNVRGLGGATLLGDGTVALILDPRTLFPSREVAR